MPASIVPPAFPNASASGDKGNAVRRKIRQTLSQAAELQEIAFETARELRGTLSDEESGIARARAQAVASAIKAWDITVDRIRELRGKPRAGSRRPAPEKPKPAGKAKLSRPPE